MPRGYLGMMFDDCRQVYNSMEENLMFIVYRADNISFFFLEFTEKSDVAEKDGSSVF